jgi:hypothetical protein
LQRLKAREVLFPLFLRELAKPNALGPILIAKAKHMLRKPRRVNDIGKAFAELIKRA